MPIPSDPYARAWADFRRRRRFLWVPVPIWTACFVLSETVHSPVSSFVVAFFATLGVLAFLGAASFPCPRCRRRFDARRCRHCGLAVGTPKAAAVEAETRDRPAPGE